MTRTIFKVLNIVIIVLAVFAVIGSATLGKIIAGQVIYQNKENDTKTNSVKQLVDIWGYDLDGFNATYAGTEISAMAEDGNVVPATAFKANEESGKWVILVHGAGGDRVSVYPLAEQYLIRGINVIAIDQRGCGDNADNKVTFGINESMDVAAMVVYARNEFKASEVIAHGQSMGAQTVAIYASNVKPGDTDAADAVICDSPVPGMEYMLRSVFSESDNEKDFYNPVTNYMVFVSKIATKLLYKVDYDEADTIAVVANDMIPTMIIRSEKDQVCLPKKVQEVYNNLGTEQKTIMRVDSAHIEGVIDDPEGYMDGVMAFLESYEL